MVFHIKERNWINVSRIFGPKWQEVMEDWWLLFKCIFKAQCFLNFTLNVLDRQEGTQKLWLGFLLKKIEMNLEVLNFVRNNVFVQKCSALKWN
jgi:hypothetical protein